MTIYYLNQYVWKLFKKNQEDPGQDFKVCQFSQWMIAQMVERLLCTRRTRVQIPAPALYEITL